MSRGVRFVVLSSPKSGSTWMRLLISACPGMHCGETAPFGRYSNESNPTGARTTLDEAAFRALGYTLRGEDQERASADLAFRFWDAAAAFWRDRTGATVYGEKFTPHRANAENAIRTLAQYDTELRLVRLVRDGRDVVVSGAAHQLNIASRQDPARPSEWASPEDAARCLEQRRIPNALFEALVGHWQQNSRAMLETRSLFRCAMDVRYEQLLQSDAAAASMLRFVAGEDIRLTDDDIARATREASFASLSGGRAAGDEERTSFFRKGVAGDWVNWFTDEQTERFDRLAGRELRELGYTGGSQEAMAC